jgi:hypothetical protein
MEHLSSPEIIFLAGFSSHWVLRILFDSIRILIEDHMAAEAGHKNDLRRGEMFSRMILIRITLISITLS